MLVSLDNRFKILALVILIVLFIIICILQYI